MTSAENAPRPEPTDKMRPDDSQMVWTPQPEAKHRCDPPTEPGGVSPEAVTPPGAIWRCGRCGRYWSAEEWAWRPAKWRERRKTRKAATS